MKHEERRRGAAPLPAASSSAGGAGLGEMALARHEIEREGEAGSDEGQGEIKPALRAPSPIRTASGTTQIMKTAQAANMSMVRKAAALPLR